MDYFTELKLSGCASITCIRYSPERKVKYVRKGVTKLCAEKVLPCVWVPPFLLINSVNS